MHEYTKRTIERMKAMRDDCRISAERARKEEEYQREEAEGFERRIKEWDEAIAEVESAIGLVPA